MANQWKDISPQSPAPFNPDTEVSNVLTSGHLFVGDASNIPTDVAMSGDATIVASGAVTIANAAITNLKIASSAVTPNLISSSGAPNWQFNGPVIAKGVAGVGNAAAGYIGEYASTAVTAFVDVPGATTQWADATSLVLTPGDWDMTLVSNISLNGAVMTAINGGISVTAGNSTSGLFEGDNFVASAAVPVGTIHQSIVIPAFRASLAVNTIMFGKLNLIYAAGAPQYTCRLSARRVR